MALYAFDGTWNVRDSKGALETRTPSQYGPDVSARRDTAETNVHRFAEFYGPERAEYLQGVGTRFGRFGAALGGASGFGGGYRIRRMYDALCRRYFERNDTEIDIIGFSRGAALAVHFANLIATHGVRRPSKDGRRLWTRDRSLGWTRQPLSGDPDATPRIRFLGLWDTVGSFGIPLGPMRNRASRWQIFTIPENVLHSFHAMALDEVRRTFSLVQPTPRLMAHRDRHYEVWFRGVHSNLGGGYPDRGLSDIALSWMMEMYLWTLEQENAKAPPGFVDELQTLCPAPAAALNRAGQTLETLEPNPSGELGRPRSLRRDAWRHMPPGSLVHHSVLRRPANGVTDFHNANRRLLRRIPGDVTFVYDPPFFYSPTPHEQAKSVAREAFMHIPVRQADWLRVGEDYVFRGDDWVAVGKGRGNWNRDVTQEGFVAIVSAWLMAGRCDANSLTLPDTVAFTTHAGAALDRAQTVQWVLQVALAIEPFVADLRQHRRS